MSVTRVLRDDSGAGSVLALAVLATVMCLAVGLFPVAGFLVARDRAQGEADLAALEAANALNGVLLLDSAHPCDAARNRLTFVRTHELSCVVSGGDAFVSFTVTFGPYELAVRSRAGEPG